MRQIITKKISFEKSFYYFRKDKNVYNSFDCHTNTYVSFFEKNYEEVESRENDFKYVTGLMAYDDGENKYCVIHSWVEDKGMIIDTTSLANSQLKAIDTYSDDIVREIKNLLDKNICYIPYLSLSNTEFTAKCQELFIQCGYNQEKALKAIENYLISIAQCIEKDKRFLLEVKNTIRYEFKEGNFHIEIK